MNNPKICGAKKRGGRGICQSRAVMPNGRCRIHGGKSLKGIASPRFKDGRWSRYMGGGDLAQRFREARNDPELLRLDRDVALMEARLVGLLDKAEAGGAGIGGWLKLREHWQASRALAGQGKREEATAELGRLGAEIERGIQDQAVWMEVRDVVEQRRKLIDSIRKHAIQEREALTLDRAMALFTALAYAVKRNVQDREERRAIQEEWARLMQGQDRRRLLEVAARDAVKEVA